MDNIGVRMTVTGCRALPVRAATVRPQPNQRVDRRMPGLPLLGVINTEAMTGMPAVHENSVQQSKADGIVGALYMKMVKRGELAAANADLEQLCQVLSESVGVGELEVEQRVSNIYLGKALNILCRLVGEEKCPCDTAGVVRVLKWCVKMIRARSDFTLENLSLIMFHLGGLVNFAPVSKACSELISNVLVPYYNQMIKDAPLQAAECAAMPLGLISALRAAEGDILAYKGRAAPSLAPDALFITLRALLDAYPDLLTRWESRSLAFVVKYGVQYLSRLAQMGKRCSPTDNAIPLQLDAARLLKPVIEEARQPARGVWDQRNSGYHSLTRTSEIRDLLAYGTRYYCRWLARQSPRIQARFELAEPPRGPFPDNPRDTRLFAQVAGMGMEALTMEAAPINATPVTDAAVASAAVLSDVPTPPSSALVRFNAIAQYLAGQGRKADRFDREDAIAAANALIVSIESGRATLTQAQRVQMLLNMDAVCQHLATAASGMPSSYAWQLSSMRGFLSVQLAQVVDAQGKQLMAADLPASPGISAWQRSLLAMLNSGEDESQVLSGRACIGAAAKQGIEHCRENHEV
jgi:hypothetical protein